MPDGGGIIAPPGPPWPCWNGLDAIFPALNAAATIQNSHINILPCNQYYSYTLIFCEPLFSKKTKMNN